jgi:hypothetical protein
MPTGRADAARILGVHQTHRHASPRRLIGDIRAQLEERPGMPLIAMFVSNRCSRLNPTEVFERDCLARYGGFMHELLADTVVRVLGLALELPQLQVQHIPFFL